MDQVTIEAMRDVEHIRNNAAGERRDGLRTTDAELLAEHLVEALARVHELESIQRCELTDEKRKTGEGCDIDPMCVPCALVEAKKARNCGLSPEDRESGKACPVWGYEELEKCCACELADEKRERATAEKLALEDDDERIEAAAKELAKMREERDRAALALESRPADGKSTDVIAALRSDLAISEAKRDCGMDPNERAAYKFCLRADLPGGPCSTCAAAKMQRDTDGLNNTVAVLTHERNQLLIEVQTRAATAPKSKAVKAHADATPSLFGLMSKVPEVAPKKRRRRSEAH